MPDDAAHAARPRRRRGGRRAGRATASGSRSTTGYRRTSSGPGGRHVLDRAGSADHRAARARGRRRPPSGRSRPNGVYVRSSIVEQLPDPLSPLFADLVDASVTRSLQAARRVPGRAGVIRDGDSGFRPSTATPTTVTAAAGMIRLTPPVRGVPGTAAPRRGAMARALARPRRTRSTSGRGRGRRSVRGRDLARAPSCWTASSSCSTPAPTYYTAVQAVIPLAASSETFFTGSTTGSCAADDPPAHLRARFRQRAHPCREVALRPRRWAREQPELAERCARRRHAAIAGRVPAGVDAATWQEWRDRFQHHLDRFGHTVYNLDFVHAGAGRRPRARCSRRCASSWSGGGADPVRAAARLGAAAARRRPTRCRPARPAAAGRFRRLLRWAQRVAPLREDALADVGLAWPQLRRMLARARAAAGRGRRRSTDPDDVFWLHRDGDPRGPRPGRARTPSPSAGALWRGQRRVTPPQVLPRGS